MLGFAASQPHQDMRSIKLLFITNVPQVASFAVEQGVDRIWVDLEIIGKQERQGHLDSVISRHVPADVTRLRPHVPPGALLVRINPVHGGTAAEVDDAIARGADILMLPMFTRPDEVDSFCRTVAGRARACLLVETIGAMESLHECIRVAGVDEVHIGLNDLHLQLGCRFMFEPLASGLVDQMAGILNAAAVPFGIGGVARVGEGHLPAQLLLAEHARLGSQAVILSRTFHRQARSVDAIRAQMDFAGEIAKLRQAFAEHCAASAQTLAARHREVIAIVAEIVAALPPRRPAGEVRA